MYSCDVLLKDARYNESFLHREVGASLEMGEELCHPGGAQSIAAAPPHEPAEVRAS